MKRSIAITSLLIVLISAFISIEAAHEQLHQKRVGLLIVATGKYIDFVGPLLDSADKYFCANHAVTYFVFTDGRLPVRDNLKTIYQKRLGWPRDTLMRHTIYHQHRDILKDMDYLFATDADMLFVDTIGDEILSDRVATLHPGYFNKKGTYEHRKASAAYVKPEEAKHYFCGGFNGGSSVEFLKMSRVITENILKDLSQNIIAIWHDESHINRYFVNNIPTKILSPSYCMPSSEELIRKMGLTGYPRKLLALVKGHEQLRR
ncbi:MAG TPA: hypothetical protein ENH82_12225 [bacterium]|nr:hypothetical protein [bacterium]